MIPGRRRIRLLLTLLGIILLSVLGFLYAKKHGFDESNYFENVALLSHLKQLDAQWELDVLRSRFGINTHYDRLTQSEVEMARLLRRLQANHGEGTRVMLAGAAPDPSAVLHVISTKAALIEQFKSHNSILRNSLAFLPTAAADVQLALAAISDSGAERSSAQVSKLLLASVLFSQDASAERGADIRAGLEQLDLVQTLPAPALDTLAIFRAHVVTVLREQPAVNELVAGITAVPTAQCINDVNDALSDAQRAAVDANRRYDRYLLQFSIIVVGLLLYAAVTVARNRVVIQRVNKQLQKANENLERRVLERTRELDEAQTQLIATARQAGMAEIATNVLHNVGNVLNAVNISAGLVSQQLRSSKLKGLARAASMIDQHADDLGHFLSCDAKGKLLPAYLREVVQAIASEHERMTEELGTLGMSVDHIKHVIATQQSYAGVSRLVESILIVDLVADALSMNAGSLTRHKVHVVNTVAQLPALPLDRNRLLMILVNLISNAKHAMRDTPDVQANITLGASLDEQRVLRITVADNGEGIAAENLTRIFGHGFTTRKTGHGFGLHSCVLAAQEMGGQLTVHSDGVGQGACFTLEIPTATATPTVDAR